MSDVQPVPMGQPRPRSGQQETVQTVSHVAQISTQPMLPMSIGLQGTIDLSRCPIHYFCVGEKLARELHLQHPRAHLDRRDEARGILNGPTYDEVTVSRSRSLGEAQSSGPDRAGALSGLPITRVDNGLAFESARKRAKDVAQRARRTRKATLVLASALAESRGRWIQRLQDTLAVCEVTERRALEQVMAHLRPDILVVDLTLPGLRRVRGLRDIQRLSPSTKVLALTDAPAEGEGVFALKAGAKGYCARSIEPEHLKKAVATVQKGEIWAPRKLLHGLIAELLSLTDGGRNEGLRPNLDARLDGLTARQRMIADLISRGACNKDIANRLNISERTVKAHLTEAFRSTGVSDRLQLALLLKGHPCSWG